MESSESLPTDKSCNQESRQLLVCQTTEGLETWKLNEQQQQLVDASGLGNLIQTANLAIDQSVLRAFCELWSKETNTALFHDFEMAPSLRDAAYILGVPVTGRAVTTGAVLNKSAEELYFQSLGRIPGSRLCRGSHVKLSWLHAKFSKLSEHPSDDEIVYSTRAYLLYLIGGTIFPERERGYVSSKYLPLLSDFEKIREYAWGAAALAHMYKGLSGAVIPSSRRRLPGSASLLMGWIYEYIPAMRPDMEDAPALVFPRIRRWEGNTISQPKKEVSDITRAFSNLRVSDVDWEPYKGMDPAFIPNNCAAPDNVCFSRTWLISFNVREIYVPDRYARQFGRQQRPLNDVPRFQRHQWNASVDWSLEYASEIKLFEQLINAAHGDHTTFGANCSATAKVFDPVTAAQPSPDLNLVTVVENIKKELPTIALFLEQHALPVEVARSLARVQELVETCHFKGSDLAADALARQLATTVTLHDPETADNSEPAPDEAVQNGSNPVPECSDEPRKEGAQGGSESGEVENHDIGDAGDGVGNRKKRPRRFGVEGRDGLRRSSRHCVHAMRFRPVQGKGSQPSDPVEL